MEHLDLTLSNMENSRFVARYSSLIKEIAGNSNMSLADITCLVLVYYKFVKLLGPSAKLMQKRQFYTIYLVFFGVSDIQVIERSMLALTKDFTFVGPQSWVQLFDLYTTDDINVRMRFAFEVYDTKGTGVIDREQVGVACDKFFEGDDEDEINELKADMIEFLMKKFDLDKDGFISFDDYSTVVTKQPTLIEFLGWVFPSKYDLELMAHVVNFDSILKL
ncbi:EF-hand calcium-binding domain-containing protein 1-like [Drosophila serrata]|uniref:EF-hand calcium-binding domain-containing protein 1-like n=1 Tax=Drosophila serrata TaxID=7274 RepID=UPI000A1D195D|nr:EF-hand calcium-binding domain-containing protein 1-like [Drosophila serrata]KAH8361912.1 hypothetical protein KR200_008358 [Drosophila serrata]